MKNTTRLAAYILSFTAGYGVPLVALATVQDGFGLNAQAHHTSSRMVSFDADASYDEMEALRLRLWALTENGGTVHCDVDGVTAPCAQSLTLAAQD